MMETGDRLQDAGLMWKVESEKLKVKKCEINT
jgi:hypothetical protein